MGGPGFCLSPSWLSILWELSFRLGGGGWNFSAHSLSEEKVAAVAISTDWESRSSMTYLKSLKININPQFLKKYKLSDAQHKKFQIGSLRGLFYMLLIKATLMCSDRYNVMAGPPCFTVNWVRNCTVLLQNNWAILSLPANYTGSKEQASIFRAEMLGTSCDDACRHFLFTGMSGWNVISSVLRL